MKCDIDSRFEAIFMSLYFSVNFNGCPYIQLSLYSIDSSNPPILERLNINTEGFVELMVKQDDLSRLSVMGSTTALSHYVERLEKKFIRGIKLNERIFT